MNNLKFTDLKDHGDDHIEVFGFLNGQPVCIVEDHLRCKYDRKSSKITCLLSIVFDC